MITAFLFLYGDEDPHVNRGEWTFVELPRAGDLIALPAPPGEVMTVGKVRHVEHHTKLPGDEDPPLAIIIADATKPG